MSATIDTTPDYPEQPPALVEAAERDLPAVLQEMPNEGGNGASDPGHGHRGVLAEKLVEVMAGQKGHGKAAAAWAIHRLAERGLLRCEVAREFYPRVVGQRQVPGRMMFGVQRYREEPIYGTKEVPLLARVNGRLMDRDEFRTHCDHHKNRDAILANLR